MKKDTKDSAVVVIPKQHDLDSFFTYMTPQHKIFGGRYRLPGGKIKKGESCKESLSRELLEEYDIKLDNIQLYYAKPNVLGGTIYLCSANKIGNPSPKEDGVGEVEWMNTKSIFESNMVPNCKIALCAYLVNKEPRIIQDLSDIIFADEEFYRLIKTQANTLYQMVKQYL